MRHGPFFGPSSTSSESSAAAPPTPSTSGTSANSDRDALHGNEDPVCTELPMEVYKACMRRQYASGKPYLTDAECSTLATFYSDDNLLIPNWTGQQPSSPCVLGCICESICGVGRVPVPIPIPIRLSAFGPGFPVSPADPVATTSSPAPVNEISPAPAAGSKAKNSGSGTKVIRGRVVLVSASDESSTSDTDSDYEPPWKMKPPASPAHENRTWTRQDSRNKAKTDGRLECPMKGCERYYLHLGVLNRHLQCHHGMGKIKESVVQRCSKSECVFQTVQGVWHLEKHEEICRSNEYESESEESDIEEIELD